MAAVKKPAVAESVESAVEAALAPINSFGEKVRETAEKGLEQAKAQFEAVKEAAEKASGQIEESLTAAKDGAVKFNTRALELARSNINASFDHVQALLGAKSVQDFVSLNTEFAKSQIASLQEQAKELATMSQKAAADAAEQVKAAVPGFKK